MQPSLFVLIDMYRKQAKGSREQHNRFPFASSLTSRSASHVQAKQNAHPMKSTTRATRKDINTPVLGHKLMPSSIHSSADSCHYQQQCTKKASRREMILPCQRRLMQFRVPTSPIRPSPPVRHTRTLRLRTSSRPCTHHACAPDGDSPSMLAVGPAHGAIRT